MKEKIREYLDYFLPREVLGPVFIVFSLEHIIEILFTPITTQHELLAWTTLFVFSLVLIGYWGMADDDYDEFQDELEQ